MHAEGQGLKTHCGWWDAVHLVCFWSIVVLGDSASSGRVIYGVFLHFEPSICGELPVNAFLETRCPFAPMRLFHSAFRFFAKTEAMTFLQTNSVISVLKSTRIRTKLCLIGCLFSSSRSQTTPLMRLPAVLDSLHAGLTNPTIYQGNMGHPSKQSWEHLNTQGSWTIAVSPLAMEKDTGINLGLGHFCVAKTAGKAHR